MKIFGVLVCLFMSLVHSQAQYYSHVDDFNKAWPQLIQYSGYFGGYSPYKYFVGDINQDDLPDVFSFVETYATNRDQSVLALTIALSRTSKAYKIITIDEFCPFDAYSHQSPNALYIDNISMEDKNLSIHLKDARYAWYLRVITIGFNKQRSQLEIVRDGGRGVVSGIHEAYYVQPLAKSIEDFDWNYLYDLPAPTFDHTYKTIVVKSREAFFAALGDHREIILDMPVLDLSRKQCERYYGNRMEAEQGIDNTGILHHYTDLTITGKMQTDIIVDNTLDDVWHMENCKFITLNNLNFYHVVPTDSYCEGEVLIMNNCTQVHLNNCQFNGSGMIGIRAENISNLIIDNSKIFNNSMSALRMDNIRKGIIKNTEIYRNNARLEILFFESSDVTFENCILRDNRTKARIINLPPQKQANQLRFINTRFVNNIELNEDNLSFDFPGSYRQNFVLGHDFIAEPDDDIVTVVEATEAASEDIAYAARAIEEVATAASDLSSDEEITRDIIARRKHIIRAFVAAENARNLSSILSLFSGNLVQYWDQRNPSRAFLEKTYQNSWSLLKASQNEILGIRVLTKDRFILHTMFTYTHAKTGNTATKDSHLELIFDDDDKIISIKPHVQ
jgi:hypothetical protein